MKMQAQPVRVMSELDSMKDSLDKLVIGQDDVLRQLVNSLSRCMTGLADQERPLLSMLFLGPTGVGKTETARALAQVLFGNRKAFTRINCQEYGAKYNVSKLLGSPPGYVGGETKALLSQQNLDKHFHKARKNNSGLISKSDSILSKTFSEDSEKALSILLFDEIEKAHPKLWDLLLSIIDDGLIVLGNNEEVDFTSTIIICTSNVGSRAITAQLSGSSIGFDPGNSINDLRKDIGREAKAEAKKVFSSEWLNRMDEISVFNVLDRQNLLDILDVLITRTCERTYTCSAPFLLEFSKGAKHHIVDNLENREWGARPLSRMLEKEIITPVSHKVFCGKIERGDLVTVKVEDPEEGFIFSIESGMTTEVSIETALSSGVGNCSDNPLEVIDDSGAKEEVNEPKTRRERRWARKLLKEAEKDNQSFDEGGNEI